MVLMNEPPWRWIILMGAPFGPGSGQVKRWNCCSMELPQKPSPIQLTGGFMTISGSRMPIGLLSDRVTLGEVRLLGHGAESVPAVVGVAEHVEANVEGRPLPVPPQKLTPGLPKPCMAMR